MGKSTDVRVTGATLYFLPIATRVPLKFGTETLTSVTCARVRLRVRGESGAEAEGWGETPLNVQWVWPSALSHARRHERLMAFCADLARAWADFNAAGHALEVGHAFLEDRLPECWRAHNAAHAAEEPMPWLGALVCCSAFDLALHDAYGHANGLPVYETYNAAFMNADLAAYLAPAAGADADFAGRYPADYLAENPPAVLPAWHLVGGKDWIFPGEDDGSVPDDGYPVFLRDWIQRDGLKCLKIKLRGDDAAWDYGRIAAVGQVAVEEGVDWLSADFNCTVTDPAYVTGILDKLIVDFPRIYAMILYVEQPFPYDLDAHRIDVRSVSARKPLFMDESAHDWRVVLQGRELGWTGVALKTCKTQTGALLSLCWARAHGMTLMVQDLTNPMLAQIPHCRLAQYADTIMGVETNGMQFYPEASAPEAAVHPGLYQRRGGIVDLATLGGPGFGMRVDDIRRELPDPVFSS